MYFFIASFSANAQSMKDTIVNSALTIRNDSLYQNGIKAAEKNYKGYKTISTITLVTTIFDLPLGLIPFGSALLTKPNLTKIDDLQLKEPNYYNGYFDKAKSIRKKKVGKNLVIGSGIFLVVFPVGMLFVILNAGSK